MVNGSLVRLCRKLGPISLDLINEFERIAETKALGSSAYKFFDSFLFDVMEESLQMYSFGVITALFDGDSDAENDSDIRQASLHDMMYSKYISFWRFAYVDLSRCLPLFRVPSEQ